MFNALSLNPNLDFELWDAAKRSDLTRVKALLSLGARVDVAFEGGNTSLHVAKSPCLDVLFDRSGFDGLFIKNDAGTSVWEAPGSGRFLAIEAVIKGH